MFILASSVCQSLQCQISALTQGGELAAHSGCRAQFCCGEGEALQTSSACMCRQCLQRMDHAGFAPAHRGVCFPGLLRACLGPAFCVLPRSKLLKVLGNSTRAQTLLGIRSVPVRGPSSSGSQELGEHCLRWAVRLTTSPVPAARFPRYAVGVPSQLCISSGELTLGCNLLAGVNRPGSQVDVVSGWGPAHSLVKDAVSG